MNDDVIIVGSLNDKELRNSINELVKFVGNKTNDMADKFTKGLDKMKLAMKDFAVTQKVSVDLMKEAWRNMSSSFDAMVAAQSAVGSRGGTSGGGSSAQPNTIAELRARIKEQAEIVNQQQRGTIALQEQVNIHGKLRSNLRDELRTTEEITRARIKESLKSAKLLPNNDVAQIEKQIQALERIRNSMRNAGFFKPSEIQSVSREIDKLRDKIDKIRSKQPLKMRDVLGMDESSVDAIAKKMAALKRVSINPNNATQVKRLGDEYQRLSRLQSELLGRNIQATHSNNMLAQSFGYIRNRVVYALTLGAITNFTKQIYEIRGQYELLERSLGVLVNSFEKGSQIFQELNTMAIESPFTLMELAGAAKQLTAYNFEANEVVDTTRRLADISAALGVPMERLVYNLGQIRAQTVLTARDARDFANAGLAIVPMLANYYTELEGKVVSTGDVFDRMKNKMVSYTDVMAVLNKITDQGGKFFEFQAKQAETLRVQMANLTLAYNNMLNEMGENNQALLSLPIQGLKALLQNWSSVNRVLENVILSLGFLKVAQMIAIRNNMAWAASAGSTAKQMGFLANTIKGLGKSIGAMAANPWTWVFLGLLAVTDLIGQFRAARIELEKLNDEIRKNATEASNSNIDWLNNKGNKAIREAAKEGKLSAEQAAKAWESVEQQLNQSASSANALIGELWQINNVNERVAKGFDYVEKIQKAQAALQDLRDDTIELTSDKGWWGVFGEGLVSDLKDYADTTNKYLEIARKNNKDMQAAMEWMGKIGEYKNDREEFLEEIETTAESINNFITAYNITDPLQINEILSRVRAQIKTRNPEIKGELATLFDVSLDERMSALTNGAVDKNASLWAMFMERLKHNYHHAFEDITDEWIKTGKGLSDAQIDEQQKAIDQNLEHFKDAMPLYYDAIKKMVDDASQLRIQIGIAFNAQQLTDFQKQVQERIGKAPKVLDFGNDSMLPTQNDNLQTWVKTQQDAIKALREQNKLYAKDSSKWSKAQIKANNDEIQQRKNLLDLFNQSYEKEKKTKGKTSTDYVAEAIKQELSIIKEMRSNYDKLRKAGIRDTDALKLSAQGYELTLERVNNVLQKFGISKFNASDFAGKNVRQLLDSLTKQRDTLIASGKVKTSSLKDLEVEIQKLTIDAKTYDMKMITDGLNSELGKLKDEYELAVELDANPELGNMFLDMFNIDASDFPKTIDEYMSRVQQEFDNARKKLNLDVPLNIFKAGAKEWEEWGKQVGLVVDVLDENGNVIGKNTDALDKITPKFKEAQGVAKKWAQDTVKSIQDLEYKLGDINKKIEIENAKLKKLEDQAANETNARLKHLLELRIQEQKEAIEKLKMESVKLLPFYENLFGDMYNVSVRKLKEIAKVAKEVMSPRQGNSGVGYTQRTDNKGKVVYDIFAKDKQGQIKKTTISLEEYIKINKQIDGVQQKIAESSPWEKIKDSFSKKEGGGLKNFASGMDAIGGEMQKVANITKEIGSFAEALGADENTVETINDIATSIGGVATAAQGIGQIASGDYIGGAASVLSGVTSVIGTWMDNRDKKIDREIKNSELAVKRLENAYKNLQRAIEEAFGAQQIGARKAAIVNKELQLAELQRQLQLERGKSSKKRDAGRIADLEGQIIELENELKDMRNDITNSFLGISSVSDAVKAMMDDIVNALRNGEDAMQVFNGSIDDMIANMIKQVFAARILGPMINNIWENIDKDIQERGKGWDDILVKMRNAYDHIKTITNDTGEGYYLLKNKDGGWAYTTDWGTAYYDYLTKGWQKITYEEWKAMMEGYINQAQKALEEATTPTTDDIRRWAGDLRDVSPELEGYISELENILHEMGLIKDATSEQALSKLQQGIASVSEDTAGAIEAYMNSVSQQVYLQSDILTQIRDTILGFELDAQVATLSQMLLQLQQSYVVQQNIENLLQNVINPSGRAFMVELVS